MKNSKEIADCTKLVNMGVDPMTQRESILLDGYSRNETTYLAKHADGRRFSGPIYGYDRSWDNRILVMVSKWIQMGIKNIFRIKEVNIWYHRAIRFLFFIMALFKYKINATRSRKRRRNHNDFFLRGYEFVQPCKLFYGSCKFHLKYHQHVAELLTQFKEAQNWMVESKRGKKETENRNVQVHYKIS